ncbi:MAG: Maf family nucleotide pyrophosphatase [Bacteroidales bacterium]|nr:Maf family nucleotide pyrophosphatase [Bacteroidales bacterium]
MLLKDKLKNTKIILASASPRRHNLFREMGLDFEVQIRDTIESYPDDLRAEQIPLYLCRKKADAFVSEELKNTILITADTIVWLDSEVLSKPVTSSDAEITLGKLSGKKHEVITAVCIKSENKLNTFYSSTDVYFKDLSLDEIKYYIEFYKPFDKAGAYGIQEWIGYTGIYRIEGSYFNVMGLPTQKLYEELLKF